jgi:hypothetical protein
MQLPNIPASVSSCTPRRFLILFHHITLNVSPVLGGRTYPLEGAASLFPLHAPYTDPLEVLICGGSTPGPGTALDNCVSIQPEAENATWTIERMVSVVHFELPVGKYILKIIV